MVGADVNKRVLHALADSLADGSGYAFTGVDVRLGWGGVVTVTIFGETDDGVPGSPGPRPAPSGRDGARRPSATPCASRPSRRT